MKIDTGTVFGFGVVMCFILPPIGIAMVAYSLVKVALWFALSLKQDRLEKKYPGFGHNNDLLN